ncbi:MAG TPA: hypothetical protein VJS44_06205 [Pyrinomonadaceae bacterium]|nr:hypothetical protein [Pyrinomonadaceae bacterium]
MRTRVWGTFLVLLTVIVALVVSSCGKQSSRTSIAPATAVPVARSLPPLPARPLTPELRSMRDRAMRESSEVRGLSFTGEVGMTELSGWEYGKRTTEMAEVLGGEEMRALGRLAAAGGVLPEGTDLAALAGSFAAVSAAATYSPLDKQVLLVDKTADRYLLAHEFTHALQDQHFDLMKLLVVRPYDLDRTEALFAVIEGDAMNVQRRLEEGEAYGRKSLEEITRQERERFQVYRREAGQLFPPLLIETFSFRYRDGARFVEEVRRKNGERGVNELYSRPPLSSEQILHPEKYFQNERPREVRLDEAAFASNGWRLVTSTPLGEIGARGVLMAGINERDATRGAAGWGGDRAFLFEREGAPPLFVWKTTWDSSRDAEEFFRAYSETEKLRAGTRQAGSSTEGDTAQSIWRAGGRLVIIRREGDSVIIVRGAEQDANSALELARR